MNDADPFAAFKDAAGNTVPQAKPEKKRRGRKPRLTNKGYQKLKASGISEAVVPKAQPDNLAVLIEVIKILTPFSSKDRQRILSALETFLSHP